MSYFLECFFANHLISLKRNLFPFLFKVMINATVFLKVKIRKALVKI